MDNPSTLKSSFLPYLPFLVLISFVSFLNILARVIFSPLTPYICEEMQLCHADTGNLFLVLSLGFALTLFSSQYLSAKTSHRFTILFSVLATGLGLIYVASTETFMQFRVALFLLGVSAGFFIPSAVALIRQRIPSHHLGKAFGIFGTAQSFAFILGPLFTQFFIQFYDWKMILNGFGLFFAVLSVLLFFAFSKNEEKSVPITVSFVREVFSWPSFWIVMILLCIINGLNIGIYNMAPDYFERHNLLAASEVNYLIIVARTISIFTAVAGGMIADRLGLKKSLVIVLVICGSVTAFMGLSNPMLALSLFCIQSPIAAALMPIIHYGAAVIAPPEKNASIVSLMAPFAFTFGAGIVPQILGFFGDYNLYAEGFISFGIVSLLSGGLVSLNAIYKHVHFSQMKSLESK